jgi:hypothetical protein
VALAATSGSRRVSAARHLPARGWWIAVLFMIGSALFALGSVPWYVDAVGVRTDAITYFAGSLFFTSAAFLQYREAVDHVPRPAGAPRPGFWVWAPRDLGWLACAVQLAGTLWFNVSTGNALRENLSAAAADQRVWRPDALGSIAFLVASALACLDVRRAGREAPGHQVAWWVATLNMTGSVAFGVSAVAAYIVPATGEVRDAELSNLGTLVGALCFLAGAALLLVPQPSQQPSLQRSGRLP